MDNKFTELIKQWLDTPADERDYTIGALYLLKLSGNQIMYRNIMANPSRKTEFIEYNIRKYYNFRVQALTHAQVEEMQKQVDVIAQEHFVALSLFLSLSVVVSKFLTLDSKALKLCVLSLIPFSLEPKKRSSFELLFVIRLGLEPRTPTLKVLCSTC